MDLKDHKASCLAGACEKLKEYKSKGYKSKKDIIVSRILQNPIMFHLFFKGITAQINEKDATQANHSAKQEVLDSLALFRTMVAKIVENQKRDLNSVVNETLTSQEWEPLTEEEADQESFLKGLDQGEVTWLNQPEVIDFINIFKSLAADEVNQRTSPDY
ncbi:MAG: hypothetical protein AAGI66_09065 [Cyanobacteria bacterium P01_H01_bin.74]